MTKICPKCNTPAPIDAGFCGSCGHQYRTRFDAGPSAAAPPGESFARSAPTGRSPALAASIVAMSCLVALLIMAVVNRGRYADKEARALRAVSSRQVSPGTGADETAADMVNNGEDPIEREAKRTLEQDNSRLQTEPPPNAIGPDGRVHLRGGGSITREQWEEANRRARSSPVFRDPMPPPPVN